MCSILAFYLRLTAREIHMIKPGVISDYLNVIKFFMIKASRDRSLVYISGGLLQVEFQCIDWSIF